MVETKHLVLLGLGHTNAHIVRQWERDPFPNCSLTCVSTFPTATYSGMLPGTLGGQFSDDQMRIDLTALCNRAGARLVLAETTGLDLQKGCLHFSDRDSIPLDLLSIGVGSMPAGWEQHAKVPSLIPIKPMQNFLARLQRRIVEVEKGAGHALKVVVVGGGVASVEIALCLQQRMVQQHLDLPLHISIVSSSDAVARGMKGRSKRRLERLLRARGISVLLGSRVTGVAVDSITMETGQRLDSDVVIWATGAAAPPVLGKLRLQTDEHGFIATSSTLQSLTDPRVFAVGDSGTVIASPAPKAGVYAVRQSPILWHNLRSMVEGGAMKRFNPQADFLKLLNTGDEKALLEYGPLTIHARWCWYLKNWIDKRFVAEFQRR